jgi:hypothetical protein
MGYVAEKPELPRTTDELRATIPGWGADLDLRNRPAARKEVFDPALSGAHWHFPERQVARQPRERSTEHAMLTPVFGTACPLKGLSGVIRRLAYARYSEGQSAHWLLLLLADRIDVIESRVGALVRGRPDNLLAETGVRAELTRHGLRSRLGRKRADLVHMPIDLLIVGGTSLLTVAAAVAIGRRLLAPRTGATAG